MLVGQPVAAADDEEFNPFLADAEATAAAEDEDPDKS